MGIPRHSHLEQPELIAWPPRRLPGPLWSRPGLPSQSRCSAAERPLLLPPGSLCAPSLASPRRRLPRRPRGRPGPSARRLCSAAGLRLPGSPSSWCPGGCAGIPGRLRLRAPGLQRSTLPSRWSRAAPHQQPSPRCPCARARGGHLNRRAAAHPGCCCKCPWRCLSWTRARAGKLPASPWTQGSKQRGSCGAGAASRPAAWRWRGDAAPPLAAAIRPDRRPWPHCLGRLQCPWPAGAAGAPLRP
mmetsp:Transcript_9919/g.18024  ORF Transcript_9919/g.18024 Transcript_9919/m.18024 type:complete len:244 (+) Transcript_9919:753-1484(+)